MKKLLILLAVLLLAVSSAALAQEGTEEPGLPATFCGSLSDADCGLLTAAHHAGMGLSSATVDLQANLDISNIPDAPFDSLAFQLNGDGAYSIDAEMLSTLQSMQGAPEAMLENMEAMPQMLEQAVNSFQGRLNLSLTLPEAVTSAGGDQEIPETLSVELRLVNGVVYVDLSALAESMPDAGIPPGWLGLELSRLIRSMMEMSLQQMDAQGGFEGMLPPGFDMETFSQFGAPDMLADFVTVERLDDADVDGAAVAAFRTTIDYGGLFSSEAFMNLMEQQMDASGETLTEADREEAMQMVQQMFQGMSFETTEYVDLDDNYVRRSETHFGWDLSSMMSVVGEDTGEGAPVINFDFTITYDDFNNAPAVEAPDDAQVLTAEQVMAMVFGGMMQPGEDGGASVPAVEATPTATPGS